MAEAIAGEVEHMYMHDAKVFISPRTKDPLLVSKAQYHASIGIAQRGLGSCKEVHLGDSLALYPVGLSQTGRSKSVRVVGSLCRSMCKGAFFCLASGRIAPRSSQSLGYYQQTGQGSVDPKQVPARSVPVCYSSHRYIGNMSHRVQPDFTTASSESPHWKISILPQAREESKRLRIFYSPDLLRWKNNYVSLAFVVKQNWARLSEEGSFMDMHSTALVLTSFPPKYVKRVVSHAICEGFSRSLGSCASPPRTFLQIRAA
ncbi:hypothetical protein F4604DRAFT_1903426 [Suillus subluteus]|nr:hypothetical protein F4604DRAFT_1903426 [Suillus subluteus]